MNLGIPPTDDDVLNETQSMLSIVWERFFSQLVDQLNKTFTNLGYIFPDITENTANKINQAKTDLPTSQVIVYNSDNKRFELSNNGNLEGIQTVSVLTAPEITQAITESGNIGRIYVNSDDNTLQFTIDGVTLRTVAST